MSEAAIDWIQTLALFCLGLLNAGLLGAVLSHQRRLDQLDNRNGLRHPDPFEIAANPEAQRPTEAPLDREIRMKHRDIRG